MAHPGRYLLASTGILCVGLGLLGLFLPLLPTTPFLLLAAACFARSSDRLHRKLIENHLFGPLIQSYQEERAIPRRAKITALILLWAALGSSILFWVPLFWVQILLLAIGLAVSAYLVSLKTAS